MYKRIFDVFGASVLLVVTLPLWLLTALVLRLDTGPIFFTQMRLGLHGREFRLIKFASMRPGSELVVKIVESGDSRITPTGAFIRRHHLDELPQLLNVIRGDMSLVGPRPLPIDYINGGLLYTKEYLRRTSVHPGLTGLAQVHGGRRLVLNKGFGGVFRLDAFYAQHHGCILDMRILLATVPLVLRGDGI